MDKFVIRKPRPPLVEKQSEEESSKRCRKEINLDDLPADPMDRKRLSEYNPNDRERVRRAYLLRGPYQPSGHKFPQTTISRKKRKFNVKWFKLYKPWLEYSVKGDAAYCLYCYLCSDNVAESDDTNFVKGGFRNWKKSEKFRIHIGGVNSSHNQCRRKCEDLMNQNQHIEHSFVKQTPQMKREYEMRLLASIDCVRWCLHQGISFRAHDESDDSINMGNFKELHKFIGRLVNVVGGSCKRKDILREKQAQKIVEAMSLGEIENGRGLHQEYTLQRANDTRWSSHCKALINTGILFPSIVYVLGHVMRDGASSDQKGKAKGLLTWLSSFDFAFTSIMMKNILRITNTLALALQKKDLEIVNATELIRITKRRIETMRSDGWESLFKEVSTFCHKYTIAIPKMDDAYELPGRPRRLAHKVTLLHHYKIEIFKAVIDWVLQELNNRFDEVTTELLVCMRCLRPNDSFSAFNKDKLVRLAELYPSEFSELDRVYLDDELETFLFDMKSNPKFAQLKGIAHLASKLVKEKKHIIYPLVYRLITLVLVLPVSTASVERSFSAMKIVKTRLRNKIGDEWMNDCLVTYIEKEVFESVSNDLIMHRFQDMAKRRYQLPNKS